MNKVILRGHLGADVRFNLTTTNQKAVANFRMATNKTYTDAAGNKVKTAEWHNVVCWNRLAETVRDYCHKGSNVLVEAELRTREFLGQTQYENGAVVVDGAGNPIMVKRYTTEIVAKSVEFLDKPTNSNAYPQNNVAAAANPVAAAPVAGAPVVAAVGNPAAPATTFVGAPVVDNNVPPVAPMPAAPVVNAAAPTTVAPVAIPGVPQGV